MALKVFPTEKDVTEMSDAQVDDHCAELIRAYWAKQGKTVDVRRTSVGLLSNLPGGGLDKVPPARVPSAGVSPRAIPSYANPHRFAAPLGQPPVTGVGAKPYREKEPDAHCGLNGPGPEPDAAKFPVQHIAWELAKAFGLTMKAITSVNNGYRVSRVRHLVIWRAMQETVLPCNVITDALKVDRSLYHYAVNSVEAFRIKQGDAFTFDGYVNRANSNRAMAYKRASTHGEPTSQRMQGAA